MPPPRSDARVVAVLQARMTSTRLPGKVLAPILGRPMLARQIERVRRSLLIDDLVVATSETASDDPVFDLCAELAVACVRGSLTDVLGRFHGAVKPYGSPLVVRLTADCPLADPTVIDGAIELCLAENVDVVTNAVEPTFPDGLDVEVFSFRCLDEAWREAGAAWDREHVTPFIYRHPDRYRIRHFKQSPDRSHLRWTVDTAADLSFVRRVYESLYPDNPAFTTADVLALIESGAAELAPPGA
jgi:spore coat polysaccharide biosynthesis protein SpsF